MYFNRRLAILMVILLVENVAAHDDSETDNNRVSKVMSRKKRFLIFPDGSSFQLVFCTQTTGYLKLHHVVWFGNTAALAWILPTDPAIFQMFRENSKVYQDVANRRHDVIYYLDDDGRVIGKKPYKKHILVNPAFAKRSIKDVQNQTIISKHFIKEMHEKHKSKILLKDLDSTRIDFHREGRKQLYGKLESLFEALGWSGRDCVQKLLCEIGQSKNDRQGTFLEEITRAVFTLPKVAEPKPDVQDYDDAHGANGSCKELYPQCADINVL